MQSNKVVVTGYDLDDAEKAFRKVYIEAITLYEESLRDLELPRVGEKDEKEIQDVEGYTDYVDDEDENEPERWELSWSNGELEAPEALDEFDAEPPRNQEEALQDLDEPIRTRWSKADILRICNCPRSQWPRLKRRLDKSVGLVTLRQGAGNSWKGEQLKCYTFLTGLEDDELGTYRALTARAGEKGWIEYLLAAEATYQRERKALAAINKEPEPEEPVDRDELLETLRSINKDLLTRDMLEMLKEKENEDG